MKKVFETGYEMVVSRIITQKTKYLKLKVVSKSKGCDFCYAIAGVHNR
jgi:hypothetical protein